MRLYKILVIASLIITTGCAGSRQIRDNGLKYLQLGDQMPQQGTVKLKGHSVRDTVFNEGGYVWRASIIRYNEGKVYVEEDFFGNGLVNRIRVQTPDLNIYKDIRVGTTFDTLRVVEKDWEITWLNDYQLLDVVAIEKPSVHYLIKETAKPSDTFLKNQIQVDDISPESKVVAIVIM